MEPRTHARGNELAPNYDRTPPWSFNGATHSRAWKRHSSRDIIHGEKPLQWSHALTRVQTRVGRHGAVVVLRASMEPRTHARGNFQNFALPLAVSWASMEPRTHARGNLFSIAGILNRMSASMEPRTHARGNLAKEARKGGSIIASMEPRTHARGNGRGRIKRAA